MDITTDGNDENRNSRTSLNLFKQATTDGTDEKRETKGTNDDGNVTDKIEKRKGNQVDA